MTQDDVLFGFRLQLFDLAARTTVSHACRTFGVHRSTYYRWKAMVEASGLEMLRPRERRRPQMPNQLSPIIEQRIVAFALGHPGLGPKRIATRLRRPEWGGLEVSANGVYKTLVRHGLNTRAKRLSLVAGYAAPYEPPREPAPELHIDTRRPGELVGIDCFFVGRLHGTKGPVWQITAIDTYSSFAWADLVVCPPAGPTVAHTSALAIRVAKDLQAAGWQLERVLTDNGNEFGRRAFSELLPAGVAHTQIRSGRPQTTATSNDCTARSSKSAGDPPSRAFCKSVSPASNANSRTTCTPTTTTATTTDASPKDDAPQNSSTVPEKWSHDEPHLSAHPGVCSA